MKDLPRPEVLVPVVTAGLAAMAASLAFWSRIVRRAVRREPVLPYQPRRPVPWQGIDLVLVVLFFFIALGMVVDLDRSFFLGGAPAADGPARAAKPSTDHALLVLLQEDGRRTTLVWCVLIAVVVAPIAEEVFFRLLVQGWLERVERRWRRHIRFARGVSRGALPVLFSSLVFALPHSRGAGPPPGPELILHGMICQMFANVATVGFALALVRWRVGATRVDLGLPRDGMARDIGLGLAAALAVVPWVYLLQLSLGLILPEGVPADPYTLVPFAVALGFLYYRTHRIVPSIVLHMALNATSLALAWSMLPR